MTGTIRPDRPTDGVGATDLHPGLYALPGSQICFAALPSRQSPSGEGPTLVPPQVLGCRPTLISLRSELAGHPAQDSTKRFPSLFDRLRHVHNMREANVEVVAPAYVKRRSRIRA